MFRWRRKKQERDLERELRDHLELETKEQQGNGLSPEEARYAARRALGNLTSVKEATREMWGWGWLERWKQDVVYGLRIFARTPGFTAVVILTLALGIGATSAIFSIVNAVLLHPLPYRNADRLVVIWQNFVKEPNGPPAFDSYRDFTVWKTKSQSFAQLAPATWATGGQIFTGHGTARDILAIPVGIDFFSLLGVPPELGRAFQQDDLNRECTVVLRHRFWMDVFGGQKNVIGQHISLNEKPCTVIGVMPAGFTFYPDALSMWMLITPDSALVRDPKHGNVGAFGRLKPGVSREVAQKEVELLYRNEHRADPDGLKMLPVVYPLAEQFSYLTGPNLRLSVIILFAAVSFVLLIACVNIANLLLGRSLVRQKELAVRAALGSGRLRLIRQLLTEGLLLSCSGAALGILLAKAAVHYFRVMNPIEMPPGNTVSVNLEVLVFTAALAVITALLFGLAPAWKASRVDLTDALSASGRGMSLGPAVGTLRNLLVVAEVTLSLALLAGAGLLIESINRLASVPLGFETKHVLTISIGLPKWSYSDLGKRERFYREVLSRTTTLPAVESAAFASTLPLSGGRWGGSTLTIEGQPEPGRDATRDVAQLSITSAYFRVMGVALQEGRLFDDRDNSHSEDVAIVNQALVRKYFPHRNPIGRHVQVGEPGNKNLWLTIIGVTADEKDKNFFREMNWEEVPLVCRPISQNPPTSASLVIRTAKDKVAIGAAMQKEIAALDPEVPIAEAQEMQEHLSKVLAYPRFRAVVLGCFAALALLLAGVGLYGVLAQSIAQRTQEFGVRMALGAQRHDMVLLVIRQGMTLACVGVFAGLVATLLLTRFLAGLLYGVKATDPWTLAGVSLILLSVALGAIYIPARRAAKLDPMNALRYE